MLEYYYTATWLPIKFALFVLKQKKRSKANLQLFVMTAALKM